MPRKKERAYVNEFPVLDELNLYASSTKGDGNCLFRALSDQLYGDETHHSEIRQKILNYVFKNADHFAAFVGEFGETFDQYINRLRQDGVYGGDIEITGFCDEFKRKVIVYQADSLYVIEPREVKAEGCVHIAYHTYEHYSSVRKKGHPHGPVQIDSVPQKIEFSKPDLKQTDAAEWQVDLILKSVPNVSEQRIVEMLKTKDTDTVIEELLMEEYAPVQEVQEVEVQPPPPPSPPPPSPAPTTKPPKKSGRQRRLEKKERIKQKKQPKTEEPEEPEGKINAKIMYI